jgi:uncharacterized protein (DUF2252 family)
LVDLSVWLALLAAGAARVGSAGEAADGAPGDEHTSLRRRSTPRSQRYEAGKALRGRVPRSSLADWAAPAWRRSVVEHLGRAHSGRLARLIPVRVSRMAASPYAFLRGTAGLMAEDFAGLPATGIMPVICGDAHLSNFGFYASPERELVFDLNDFDEAHPGPWEWDLRRLATSVWVAGRQNSCPEHVCEQAARSCLQAYRKHLRYLAGQPLLARSYQRLDAGRMHLITGSKPLRRKIDTAVGRARRRTSNGALPRLTQVCAGQRRIVEEPPLITRVDDTDAARIAAGLDSYLDTLQPHWRRILAGYTLVDIAHKVVGVGSVGLRAYIALCEGSDPHDVLFLQLKQARRSVVAPFVHGKAAWHEHQGQRVVEYQQALQTVSDPLLGWTSVYQRQYYVRQFRDMKGAIVVDGLSGRALVDYAHICGLLLAKAHARTSGASTIAGYLGKSDEAEAALAAFARVYADQVERDQATLLAAIARGILPASDSA